MTIRTEVEFHQAIAQTLELYDPKHQAGILDTLHRIRAEREAWMETEEEKSAALALIDAVSELVFDR